ncbi:flagellar motor switch phosphatase FliY [Bacillus altitudinis MN12]|jgi:flagellar motor switch protein FliN/FliY|uniref:Flagellar motor switch protein FliN n=4 Tax=Bacillus TaxID=1386 RepID=A0A5K1NDT8_BACAB|nr:MULTISPECIES: flagellar motor switch phosphatase FliY [Bacillus]AHL71423.1 flagellar motor switch protein FliN [Bacillus pumilus]EMI13397.1 flagellar motor switch protein [Bacillus stratosphericus LAMA 585]KML03456.1 flagellar motor switch protein FliN [Bacillus stratosphericus]KQL47394.1 flagellar motor switch protein FliN [Bacillus sp. FJAT-21955]MBW3699571.1 flagellar motor switch phosphatase FliY [Bacillus aerophilus]MDH8710319.1 flagellar motor switch protein FliN/FliY [Micromonospora
MENNGSKLSQDEIDALLKGGSNDDIEPDTLLSAMEQDAIGEIGNISFGSSATALSTLLSQKVEITTPTVTVIQKSKLNEEFPHPYVAIEVNYTEGFSASNLLVIQQTDAAVIADLMMGGDGTNADPSLSEIHLSAVQEAMNQMMGSAATSMSTVFNKKIDISPPRVELLDVKEGEGTDRIPAEEMLVKVSFRLTIGELIDSNIMQLYPITFAKDLIAELTDPAEEEPVQEAPQSAPEPQQAAPQAQSAPMQQSAPPKRQAKPKPAEPVNVAPVEFEAFSEPQHTTSQLGNLDMLMDIPLSITVELGRTQRSVKEVLELSAGSIIELDKLAGEPVDILVNKRIVAKGEVVVIDENFGVRVTDILSQSERLSNLK